APCTYCSMLMMGPSVMWVPYDSSESYMLTSAFPKNVDLSKHLSISILILFVLGILHSTSSTKSTKMT
ncbi:5472_t:CDS:1, partial [Entrophospora sp. SA101]